MSLFLRDEQILQAIAHEDPIIDVRAPIEFKEGALPGSINAPIMNDEERAQVGTVYKQAGQEAAIRLGHELVSGAVKAARLQAWIEILQKAPQRTRLTCFRGGLRSKLAQEWLAQAGHPVLRLEGGYKKARQLLMETTENFVREQELLVISGATGSGKSLLLRSLAAHRQVCDLEALANHRGSSFGAYLSQQPTQINFENLLARNFLQLQARGPFFGKVLIEDESRLIGRCVQPDSLFNRLRSSEVVLVEESLESRVEVTFEDYILNSKMKTGSQDEGLMIFDLYLAALTRICKKLGGLRFAEVKSDLEASRQAYVQHQDLATNRIWIEKLLAWYYDPMYFGSLEQRRPPIVFRGSRQACFEYLAAARRE